MNTFIYRPEKNGPGLTGNEIVTIAHPMIMAMILAINVERYVLYPIGISACFAHDWCYLQVLNC